MPNREIKKVAYVTVLDSRDINNWSGILVYLHDALASVFSEVVRIGPLKSMREPVGVVRRLSSWTRKQDHPLWLTRASAKSMAYQVEEQLSGLNADAVFCVWHPPLAFLRTSLPTFMFQDSPFETIQPLYSGMAHFTPAIVKEAQLVERMAAKRCTGIIETSEWAADEARRLWRLPHDRVRAIPFGANVDSHINAGNVEQIIDARSKETCRLLWLGKEWERKGGDIAVKTAEMLNKAGIPTRITVVGCEPPGNTPEFVERVGFIDKKSEEGRQRLQQILSDSHFLILPTRAEAFGIVYLEAAAHAIPSLAPDVMGVGSAVLNGETGILLPSGSGAEQYAQAIEKLWKSQKDYRDLALRSLATYEEKFTWRKVAEQMKEFMIQASS